MKISLPFFFFSLLILSSACSNEQSKSTENLDATSYQPNILFMMSDDHAQKAISIYDSSLIHTPNIDRIGKEGMIFQNSFVSNSICAPSRAVMLTGKFSHINGKKDNSDVFNGDQETYISLLQAAGYETAVIGKWHLKSTPKSFDYWNILIGQGTYYTPKMIENGDTLVHQGYTTTVITDFVLNFLKNRDKSKPFCLIYNHKAPHRNWMPDTSDFDLYANRDLPVPETFFDDYKGRPAAEAADMRIADMYLSMDMKLMPEVFGEETGTGGNKKFNAVKNWKEDLERMTPAQREAWDQHYDSINAYFKEAKLEGKELALWKYQRYMKDYLSSIKSVDDNIGRVLDYLDETGLVDSTLVVYTSDQGFYLGEHGWFDKRFMYEESFRTPLLMRWPENIPAGSSTSNLVQNIDYAPTFLSVAGIDVPKAMQGMAINPLWSDPETEDWRDALYYHYYEYPHGWHEVKKHYGVRTDRYKLIHFYQDIDHWELYDLKEDPNELNNLYESPGYKEIRSVMKQNLEKLQKQYADSLALSKN